MKKIFKHTGGGHYIGSCCIVIANDLEEAKEMIRTELDSSGLEDEELEIEEQKIKVGIVHFVDGNY